MSKSNTLDIQKIYKSMRCKEDNLINTKHEEFTFPVLIGEIKYSVGMFIVGFLLIVIGITKLNTVTNAIAVSDRYPTIYASMIAAGGLLVGVAIWLARHDISGYIHSDIIMKCKDPEYP